MSKLKLAGLVLVAVLAAKTSSAQGPPSQFITLSGVNVEELAA